MDCCGDQSVEDTRPFQQTQSPIVKISAVVAPILVAAASMAGAGVAVPIAPESFGAVAALLSAVVFWWFVANK
jgi:hypothetical protein